MNYGHFITKEVNKSLFEKVLDFLNNDRSEIK